MTGPPDDAQTPQSPEVLRLGTEKSSPGRRAGRGELGRCEGTPRARTPEKASQGTAGIRLRGGPAALGPGLLPARSGDGQEPAAAPHHQRLPAQRQPRGARHGPARGLRTRATHSALPAGAG